MKKNTHILGVAGENSAVSFLEAKGHVILDRNYKRKTGEIDIISSVKEYLVFTEVKYRTSSVCGEGAEAVTSSKQKRIIKTAFWYIKEKQLDAVSLRFDVIEIQQGRINHIENAFTKS